MKVLFFNLLLFFCIHSVAQDYYTLSAISFFKLKEVNEIIDYENFNKDLLAAAIFHQTNLERKKRSSLVYNEDLKKAANVHAYQMVKYDFFNHTNKYNAIMKTPAKRAHHFGYPSSFVGENIIEAFGYDQENTSHHYTYKELALKLVDRWMHSAGHKANILKKEYTSLGVGVKVINPKSEFPMLYAVQVFGG